MQIQLSSSIKNKVGIAIVAFIMIFLIIGVIRLTADNFAQSQQVSKLENEVKSLKSKLSDQQKDSEANLTKVQTACQSQQAENENKVRAFAIQAEKCLPIMKKFGVAYQE